MNSVLQILYHLPAIVRSIYKEALPLNKFGSVLTTFQKLFYNLKYSGKPVTTTKNKKISFGWDKSQAYVQQDAQEFCSLILGAIPDVKGTISELFEGKISTTIDCINVHFTSVREEKIFEIELKVKGMKNIYQSLDCFTQEEELIGDNKYDAEDFGKQDAIKRIKFEEPAPVLLIYLKRFEYDYKTDTNAKISDSYEYYDEIDLNKYIRPDYEQEPKYRLFSVLVHSGPKPESGHYYVYIRPEGPDGKWFKFDDEHVGVAELSDVVETGFDDTPTEAKLKEKKEIQTSKAINEDTAYILVYIREDQIKTLLRPITGSDIPKRLIEEIVED